MIYRLSRPNGSGTTSYSYDRNAGPCWTDMGVSPQEYHEHFEEIPLPRNWKHCSIYKAPILAEWRLAINLIIEVDKRDPDFEAPDIRVADFTYVSDKVKAIIEEVDPFGHQFWPADLVDGRGAPITNKTYYRMNMRRYVTIEPSDLPLNRLDFTPATGEFEWGVIAAIQHNPELRRNIETLPMWRHMTRGQSINDNVLYFNETLFNALTSAGVTGIKEYTEKSGKTWESVAHV
ncbi:hypothetical protein EUZ85_15475 [Hahella sp. KA22]|uniref:hypothetical protein n=1 Tax=Hahella sp. KA22 TaxID=1628392 RepID=UPI000FDED85C|nr:hypothetical protein [Hahella sp. KA22]AZZ92048.1 hypothetical protein ENC22_12910 [Hahella sp. KA22]QAY55419.1 hypothetical protein EUZ85_15475 [Hahella sp. KA22]